MITQTPSKLITAGWLAVVLNIAIITGILYLAKFNEVQELPVTVRQEEGTYTLQVHSGREISLCGDSIECTLHHTGLNDHFLFTVKQPVSAGSHLFRFTANPRNRSGIFIPPGDSLSGYAKFVTGRVSFLQKIWKGL